MQFIRREFQERKRTCPLFDICEYASDLEKLFSRAYDEFMKNGTVLPLQTSNEDETSWMVFISPYNTYMHRYMNDVFQVHPDLDWATICSEASEDTQLNPSPDPPSVQQADVMLVENQIHASPRRPLDQVMLQTRNPNPMAISNIREGQISISQPQFKTHRQLAGAMTERTVHLPEWRLVLDEFPSFESFGQEEVYKLFEAEGVTTKNVVSILIYIGKDIQPSRLLHDAGDEHQLTINNIAIKAKWVRTLLPHSR